MNKIKHITYQLIKQPITLQYDTNFSIVQLISGAILLLFFLLIGVSIFIGGFKVVENRIFYFMFGAVLCLFPLLVYLIIRDSKLKLIYVIDKDGVYLKNEIHYQWENLRSVTYNTSLYERDENKRFVSVQFMFLDGEAIATYKADNFSTILFLTENLPVPKMEKSFTYFK